MGEVLQRSLAVLSAICVPILVLWLFTENVLTLLGQVSENNVIIRRHQTCSKLVTDLHMYEDNEENGDTIFFQS